MKTLTISASESHELASKEAALTLLKDGAVVFPTDTLYGLGVNALDPVAVRRLFQIKKRVPEKPVPLIINSIEMARVLAFVDHSREEALKQLWPGPYTVVLWKKKVVPDEVTAGRETVALRIPAHPFCQSMLRDFEGPVTGTSANISGEEPSADPQEIIERFSSEKEQPNLIIDAGELPTTHPSAIIDLTSDSPAVLRVNPTTKDKLLEVLGKLS